MRVLTDGPGARFARAGSAGSSRVIRFNSNPTPPPLLLLLLLRHQSTFHPADDGLANRNSEEYLRLYMNLGVMSIQ